MCGIAGFIDFKAELKDPAGILSDMCGCLSHRGPDDSGFWHEPRFGVGLAHTRLAVIDTSEAGRQPMSSFDDRWTLVFNGEIYNAAELKKQYDLADSLRGHSDTEVLCELVSRIGVIEAARRCVGMFAFAAFDKKTSELFLVRDRLGIKPLFLARKNGLVSFGSESRVFRKIPGLATEVSLEGLSGLLRFGYIPGVDTIRENVVKVLPGTCLTIKADAPEAPSETTVWWSALEVAESEMASGSDEELLSEIGGCIDSSVSSRLISDRPLGAFLSGGIDSSLVVAAMCRLSTEPVRTFSIGFQDSGYDESQHARAVASHLGTLHTECRVTEKHVLDIVPNLSTIFDEPFADSSQIPTYLLSHLTRRDVVVALSGDGGDELFGGYQRYEWASRLWKLIDRIPFSVRTSTAFTFELLPHWFVSAALSLINRIVPPRIRMRNPAEKVSRLFYALQAESLSDLYFRLLTQWNPKQGVLNTDFVSKRHALDSLSQHGDLHRMMLWDQCNYLPDDILTKVDRTSMSVGLEARVPLLDHRLVELAWQMPLRMKVRGNETKWALRRLLERDVPRELWDRPKMGFGVPLGAWLRGPLRDWAESLLDRSRLEQEGYFNASLIRGTWDSHLSGSIDQSYPLWDILMFQSWLESNS